ncbi:lysophosphatidylcholine acyltransferase 2-like isoform X1 [Antedon mediterranea]|uniref:lysophosphatidylcholine acyltransferase 2-like isoform X1 n=1 Tax=Antedon mediterranea TaxID=105859 RepID=UPI003AF78AD3
MNSRPMFETVVKKRRRLLRRASSLLEPAVRNPFVHHLNLTTLDKIRIAIMSVTVVPLRLILGLAFFPIVYLLCRIALAGLTEEQLVKEPLQGWRRMLLYPNWLIGRFQFFIMGFHYVSVKGQRASRDEAPICVISPHTAFFDILIMFVLGLPHTNSVSREENGKAPLAGTLVNLLQPVFVSRKQSNSRHNASYEITRRVQPNSPWPQLLMFPEGTCTNKTCLINFKQGAFNPGLPVQPVILHYNTDTVTWAYKGPQVLASMWLTMCNFNNKLEIEFLPVYKPSEEEKRDPALYAQNVRGVIARSLNLPVTDHSFEDCLLMKQAKKHGLPMEAGAVEFHKLTVKLGLKFSDIKEQLPKYAAIAKSKGYISIEDFAEYLQLPVSPALEEVFAMYDRDGSGTIDFREYVIGSCLVAKPAEDEETLALAFERFCGNCYITKKELVEIMEKSLRMTDAQAEELFNQVDVDKSGQITYDQFKAYADLKPEYATLFNVYQELKKEERNQMEQESNVDRNKNKTD